MKKIGILLLSALLALNVSAQTDEKQDVVLKVNGDELTGKVTEIGDSEIKFVHAGETLEYTIKKSDILKVTYASGRVEKFNTPSLPSEKSEETQPAAAANNVDHHNKVAILPFTFIKDNQSAGPEMMYKVQEEAYTYLNKHSPGYTILDPRTTNALLIKAGITSETKMGYTMEEICNVLGVEYVVEGTITQNKGVATSSTSENYKSKSTGNDNDKYYNNNSDKKVSGYSSSTSSQTYITNVTMNVFNDKNTNVYSDSHRALLANTDQSYSSPLQYLLKRTPLYHK